MDRDHALCRQCKQLVRTDWRECAHCGVRSPVPRTLGSTLASTVPLVVLVAAAWWMSANDVGVRPLTHAAEQLARAEHTADRRPGSGPRSGSSGPVASGRGSGERSTASPVRVSGTRGSAPVTTTQTSLRDAWRSVVPEPAPEAEPVTATERAPRDRGAVGDTLQARLGATRPDRSTQPSTSWLGRKLRAWRAALTPR